jgi:AcrR family transcriptional regulator
MSRAPSTPGGGRRPARKAAEPASAPELEQRRDRARQEASVEYLRRWHELRRVAAAVFHEKGLRDTTLADIAEAAGTDRATLYYYVRNKHELFTEVMRDSMTTIEAITEGISAGPGTPPERLRAMIVAMMEQYEEHFPYPSIYAAEDLTRLDADDPWQRELAGHAQHIFEMFRAVVAEGLEDRSLTATLGPGVLAQMIIGAVAWSNRWYRPGAGATQAGHGIADVLLGGLQAPRRGQHRR